MSENKTTTNKDRRSPEEVLAWALSGGVKPKGEDRRKATALVSELRQAGWRILRAPDAPHFVNPMFPLRVTGDGS